MKQIRVTLAPTVTKSAKCYGLATLFFKAELVKLRYFVGLNFEEAAAALGIAVPTAKQWWAYARSWLTVEMWGAAPR